MSVRWGRVKRVRGGKWKKGEGGEGGGRKGEGGVEMGEKMGGRRGERRGGDESMGINFKRGRCRVVEEAE